MPEIIWEGSRSGMWNPESGVILTPWDSRFKSPSVLAHEIAHWKLGHDILGSTTSEFFEEIDAWREALRRMPPEEIDLDAINKGLGSHLRVVREEYGEDSPQYIEAKRARRELMDLARIKRKYG